MSQQVEDHPYSFGATVDGPFAAVRERVVDELKERGFGILSEIDVAATLKKKIDVTRAPYVILGACNPKLANQALQDEPNVGVFLPCNVVLYETEGSVQVEAMDPAKMLATIGNPALDPIGAEARQLIHAALTAATQD